MFRLSMQSTMLAITGMATAAESLLKTIYPREPMNGLNGKQKRTEIAGVSQFLSGCSGGFLTRIHIEITVNL